MILDADGQPGRGFNAAANIHKALATLVGICSGLIADGQLNDSEILFLDTWLRDNEELCETWPAEVIAARVRAVLDDGIITEEERADLTETLAQLLGGNPTEDGATGGLATRLPVDLIAPEDHGIAGRTFCLTGKFLYGPRSRCQAAITSRGGLISANVTQTVHYLVIGTLASRDWKHPSHGLKIEKAMEYKKTRPLFIVAEEDWTKLL
jgi:NAD-dependent DNA ligase